jgi:hypothetical protein
MANLSDFLPAAGGGGGGIPKYQEFTSSGTFTPTQELIDAGGRVAYLIIGGGQRGSTSGSIHTWGGAGGAVLMGYATLTSTTACTVTVGAGGASSGAAGGNSSVAFASAGGTTVTANGGDGHRVGVNYSLGQSGYYYPAAYEGILGYGRGGQAASGGGGQYYGDSTYAAINYGNYGSGTYSSFNAYDGFVRLTWFE